MNIHTRTAHGTATHSHRHARRTPYGFTHAISHETILHVRYTQKRHKDKSMDKRLHRTQLQPNERDWTRSLLSVDGFAHRHVECHMPFVACVPRPPRPPRVAGPRPPRIISNMSSAMAHHARRSESCVPLTQGCSGTATRRVWWGCNRRRDGETE